MLPLSLVLAFVAILVAIIGHRRGYNSTFARITCVLWAVAIPTFAYWLGYSIDEGLARSVILVGGGIMGFGALLEAFKARPLSRR